VCVEGGVRALVPGGEVNDGRTDQRGSRADGCVDGEPRRTANGGIARPAGPGRSLGRPSQARRGPARVPRPGTRRAEQGRTPRLARAFPTSALVEIKGDAWITVTAAAKLLLDDTSGIDLDKAKARVSKAANEGRFRTNGKKGAARRIDRDSFSTWRLEQREKDLSAYD
jgi:hypothetical protein